MGLLLLLVHEGETTASLAGGVPEQVAEVAPGG
jgi:hypothetical protein